MTPNQRGKFLSFIVGVSGTVLFLFAIFLCVVDIRLNDIAVAFLLIIGFITNFSNAYLSKPNLGSEDMKNIFSKDD